MFWEQDQTVFPRNGSPMALLRTTLQLDVGAIKADWMPFWSNVALALIQNQSRRRTRPQQVLPTWHLTTCLYRKKIYWVRKAMASTSSSATSTTRGQPSNTDYSNHANSCLIDGECAVQILRVRDWLSKNAWSQYFLDIIFGSSSLLLILNLQYFSLDGYHKEESSVNHSIPKLSSDRNWLRWYLELKVRRAGWKT